jgi:hypothetical protein
MPYVIARGLLDGEIYLDSFSTRRSMIRRREH